MRSPRPVLAALAAAAVALSISIALAPGAGSTAPERRGPARRAPRPTPEGQGQGLRQARPPGPQRLPRQPRAAHGQQRQHPRHHQSPDQGRRRGVPGQPGEEGAQEVACRRRHAAHRRSRRPDRRQPAALGGVPRRADHRGDEPDRSRRRRRWATTSSTRASRAAAHAEGRLPRRRPRRQRPELLPRRPDLRGRRLPLPRRQRVLEEPRRPHAADRLQAVQDLQGRGPEGRLHRHDARGHRHHRQPRPASPTSTSATRSRRPTRWCPSCARRASSRSSCCCTRASRRPTRTSYNACTGVSGAGLAIAQNLVAEDRRGRERPHPPALQLRGQGPEGQAAAADQRLVVRPDRDQAALPDRPEDPRHRAAGGVRGEHHQSRNGDGPKQSTQDHQADLDVQDPGRADRATP